MYRALSAQQLTMWRGEHTNMRGDQRYSSGHQKYKHSTVHHQAKSSAAKYEECLEYNVGVLG